MYSTSYPMPLTAGRGAGPDYHQSRKAGELALNVRLWVSSLKRVTVEELTLPLVCQVVA